MILHENTPALWTHNDGTEHLMTAEEVADELAAAIIDDLLNKRFGTIEVDGRPAFVRVTVQIQAHPFGSRVS
jgi:hypothetical protein